MTLGDPLAAIDGDDAADAPSDSPERASDAEATDPDPDGAGDGEDPEDAGDGGPGGLLGLLTTVPEQSHRDVEWTDFLDTEGGGRSRLALVVKTVTGMERPPLWLQLVLAGAEELVGDGDLSLPSFGGGDDGGDDGVKTAAIGGQGGE